MKQNIMLILIGVACILGVVNLFKPIPQQGLWDVDSQKGYANSLVDKGLYKLAAEEYKILVENSALDKKKKSNLSYIIANVYLENLKDYQNALAWYIKAKSLYPKTEVMDEINQRMVECLEGMGHSLAAQQEMEKYTSLETTEGKPGIVIAKIGNRQITDAQLEAQLNELPPTLQKEYKSREKKLEFLKSYIVRELMYTTANRKGYDRDQDIVESTFEIKKNLMINKLIDEEIRKPITITDSEVELYYKANKKDFMEGKKQQSLSEAEEEIKTKLKEQKVQEAYQRLAQKMMEAEDVQIYEDLVR